jgi:hypothetical protein
VVSSLLPHQLGRSPRHDPVKESEGAPFIFPRLSCLNHFKCPSFFVAALTIVCLSLSDPLDQPKKSYNLIVQLIHLQDKKIGQLSGRFIAFLTRSIYPEFHLFIPLAFISDPPLDRGEFSPSPLLDHRMSVSQKGFQRLNILLIVRHRRSPSTKCSHVC